MKLSEFSKGVDNAIKKFQVRLDAVVEECGLTLVQMVLNIESAVALDAQGKILNTIKSQLDVCASSLMNLDSNTNTFHCQSIERKMDSQGELMLKIPYEYHSE